MLRPFSTLILLLWVGIAIASTVTVIANRELTIGSGAWSRTPYTVCNGDGALFTTGVADTLTYNFTGMCPILKPPWEIT